jgi:hypothetical protein
MQRLSEFSDSYRSAIPLAYIDPRQGPSGPYYRVRIGPFETAEQAKKAAKVLKQDGQAIFIDEIPVPYQTQPTRYAHQENS